LKGKHPTQGKGRWTFIKKDRRDVLLFLFFSLEQMIVE
jgi:hypothetical protein